MPIDSIPYRERKAPLPPWFHNWCLKDGVEDAELTDYTMTQWRRAFDIAQKFMAMDHSAALAEYYMLSPELLPMVRARWDALRGRAIDWVVEDDSLRKSS